jgi:hypothetical protein
LISSKSIATCGPGFFAANFMFLNSLLHLAYSIVIYLVHQSGELETILEDNGVIPKVEESTAGKVDGNPS